MTIPKPPIGSSANPTLTQKQVVGFEVSDDARRVMSTPSDPTGFNPNVNKLDPSARTYAQQIQQRKAASALKGKAPPLGGAPMPELEKMQAIAGLSGGGMARPPAFEEPPAFIGTPADPAGRPQAPIGGVGSGFQVNQELAQGHTDGPITFEQAKSISGTPKQFSPETVQALKMANENMQKAQQTPQPPQAEEPKVTTSQETRQELDEAEQEFEPETLDVQALNEAKNLLMTPERKKEIESRLKPLNLADMITKKELTQNVPIIPGQFEVLLRTVSQRENLWVLRYIYDYPGSVLYTQELLNTCRLVCGLMALNGALLPDHRKEIGKYNEEVDKEAFEKKMGYIIGYPIQLIADISVQQMWFQQRVDALFTVKSLKNG